MSDSVWWTCIEFLCNEPWSCNPSKMYVDNLVTGFYNVIAKQVNQFHTLHLPSCLHISLIYPFIFLLLQKWLFRLVAQRVLIFVHYDIDAICAAKILLSIFRFDAVSYTLIPITTVTDLISAYQEHKQDVSFFRRNKSLLWTIVNSVVFSD